MRIRRIFGWILAIFAVGFVSAHLDGVLRERLRSALVPFDVRASLGSWHLDPAQRALTLENLELDDANGPILRARTLHFSLERFTTKEKPYFNYAVQIIQPSITLAKDLDGQLRFGPWPLKRNADTHESHVLPTAVSILEGEIRFAPSESKADAAPLIFGIHAQFKSHEDSGEVKLDLRFSDQESGHYEINASRSSRDDGLDLLLALKNARPSRISRDLAPLPDHAILDGLFSGKIRVETATGSFVPLSIDIEDLDIDHLSVGNPNDGLKHHDVAHLGLKRLIGAPQQRLYLLDGLDMLGYSSDQISVDRIHSPHFEAIQPGTDAPPDHIWIKGFTHHLTHAESINIAAPVILEGEHKFHFDHMIVSGIETPKVRSPELRFSNLILDGGSKTLVAEKLESDLLEGAFGVLEHLTTERLSLLIPAEHATIDLIHFDGSHSQFFHSGAGEARHIDFNWSDKDLKIAESRLVDAAYYNIRMARVEVLNAAYDLTTHQVGIGQILGTGAKVIRDNPAKDPELVIDRLNMNRFHSDPEREHWEAGDVEISKAVMDWVIHEDNRFEIIGLHRGAGEEGELKAKDVKRAWTYQIRTLALLESNVTLTDEGTVPDVSLPLRNLSIHADDLNSQATDDTDIDAESDIGRKGHVKITGRILRNPLSGLIRFDLTHLHLPSLSPYWDALTRLKLRHAHLDMIGEVRIKGGESRSYEFSGDATLEHVLAVDEITGDTIVSLKSLVLDDIAYSSNPKHFSTHIIDFDEAYLHLVLDEHRKTNLSQMFGVEDASAVPSELKDVGISPTPQNELPWGSLGLLKFRNSRIDFTDNGMKPALSTTIRELQGTISGLSTRESSTTVFDLDGKINRNSPVILSGSVKPFERDDHTNVNLQFTGLNLTGFPQYAGRFSGYRIERGKLNLALDYAIEHSQMSVDYRAMIDRLTLGQKIDNETPYLVDLALWLLKDNNGNLDVDLPVYGDLENPSYDREDLYVQAFFHLFEKVLWTPANLVQTYIVPTDDLTVSVSFEAGMRTPLPASNPGLSDLADAYRSNDGGLIEITPRINPESDRRMLSREALVRQLTEAYVKAQRKAGNPLPSAPDNGLSADLLDQEFMRYCRTNEVAGLTSLGLTVDDIPSKEQMRKLWAMVIEEWHLESDLLVDLAEERAFTIRERLIDEYHLPGANIYLKPADLTAVEELITIPVTYSAN